VLFGRRWLRQEPSAEQTLPGAARSPSHCGTGYWSGRTVGSAAEATVAGRRSAGIVSRAERADVEDHAGDCDRADRQQGDGVEQRQRNRKPVFAIDQLGSLDLAPFGPQSADELQVIGSPAPWELQCE